MTTLEEQDAQWRKIGFAPYEDYKIPRFTRKDNKSLLGMILLAKKIWPEDKFFAEVCEASSPYEAMTAYRYRREQLKSLAKQLKAEGQSGVPNDDLFSRLDKYWEYQGLKEFISHDRGEMREDKAFEKDGVIVKKGFVRLYWK